jgi:predicted TIM-barrel fold metal-dependent hydrolase
MRALFELCIEHDVPIISHASDGNGFGPDYGRRASPWGWWRVLEEYPELRLDLAHFGHDHGVEGTGVALDCLAWSKFMRNG